MTHTIPSIRARASDLSGGETAAGVVANTGLLAANAYAVGAGIHDPQFGPFAVGFAFVALLMFLYATGAE